MAIHSEYSDENDIFRWCKCGSQSQRHAVSQDEDETIKMDFVVDDLNTNKIEENTSDHENEMNNESYIISSKKSLFNIYWSRYRTFVKTPKVHYAYEFIFYAVFLLIFSYTLLCKLNYYEEDIIKFNENKSNESNNYNYSENSQIELNATQYLNLNETIQNNEKIIAMPSSFEYVLIIWIILFFIDEIYQVILKLYIFHYFFLTYQNK